MVVLAAFCLWRGGSLHGATYSMSNGQTIDAQPFHFDPSGVVFRYTDGRVSPRFAWTNFTEAALKDFAQDPKARSFVSQFLESPEDDVRVRKEITVKAPPRLDRPTRQSAVGALFASPLSLALLALVYLANLYGAYEIAIYRRYPLGMVIGAAAILPFAAPIVFLCLPTRTDDAPQEVAPAAAPAPEPQQRSIPSAPPPRPAAGYSPPARFSTPGQAQQPVPAPGAEAPGQENEAAEESAADEPPPPPPAAPKLPQPVVYRRGQTMFNRRFFETKLSGFLRMIPSDAEKDLVINVKSARGEYVGNRISKLQPEELTLQYHRGSASSDVTIPFTEIQEVTVRHKDA